MVEIFFNVEQRGRTLSPTLRVSEKGNVSLNKASIAYIKPPCRVDASFEDRDKTLYLKQSENGRLKLEKTNKGVGGRITNVTFYRWLKQFGVREGRYEGKWDEENKRLTFNLGQVEY